MEKKKTALQQAIESIEEEITILRKHNRSIITSGTDRWRIQDKINALEESILLIKPYLPTEKEQMREAHEAGFNHTDTLGGCMDEAQNQFETYFTETYEQ